MIQVNSKLVPYSITSVGHEADFHFLAVSAQVTLVINPVVVGCHYFPPGVRLLSQPKRSPTLGRYQIILLGDRGTRSLCKAIQIDIMKYNTNCVSKNLPALRFEPSPTNVVYVNF